MMDHVTEHSGDRPATPKELTALAGRAAAAAVRERRFSLPSPKAGQWLGVREREMVSMTEAGLLYAFTLVDGEPRWPAWQFAYGRPLPHLAAVVAAIPAGSHPPGVRTLMTTPHPDLVYTLPLDDIIQPLIPEIPRSPATWLLDGGEVGLVLALLAAAGAI